MLTRKNILDEGNALGLPTESIIVIRIILGKANPFWHAAAKALGPAPVGAMLPIKLAKSLCTNINSNMENNKTPYDLQKLRSDSNPTPNTSPSGSRRRNSTTIGITVSVIVLIINSYDPGFGFISAEDIRPIYHIYIKQWASLHIIKLL